MQTIVDYLIKNCPYIEEICLAVLHQSAKNAEAAFGEWAHSYLKHEHISTTSQGWLKKAWIDSWNISKSLEEK